MSEIKVNSIKGVGASTAAITVNNTDGTCTANLTNRTNRNLVINGAMNVAQRLGGGVATNSQGYQTVDRFQVGQYGADEALTQMQGSVSSGTTPYTLGFRNTLKITNGNQTSGADASDYAYIDMALEGQDIAGSGWNYNSASSFITFSFWIKSSVAQSFKGYFSTEDGTSYQYPYDTGSLSADTWTKVTKTIPGNSNLTINNDNGVGFRFSVWPYIGTTYTASSVTEDAWSTFASAARTKDATSTWWTTNDATFEITGVQLEVGSVATDFEHRSFGQELALCQRYFYLHADPSEAVTSGSPNEVIIGQGCYYGSPDNFTTVHFPVRMRTTPTLVQNTGTNYYVKYRNNGADFSNSVGTLSREQSNCCTIYDNSASGNAGDGSFLSTYNASARVSFSSEL